MFIDVANSENDIEIVHCKNTAYNYCVVMINIKVLKLKILSV